MENNFTTTTVKKWGGTHVLILKPQIMHALGWVHRDVVGVRKVGRCLLLKRLVPGEVMPLSSQEAETAALEREG